MAAVHGYLSLEQFESLYRDEKPYAEYWFGAAFPKSMPTVLHSVVQSILIWLLMRRGWKAAPEVGLKLSAFAHPIPDVIADSRRLENSPYPTKPFDLCIEILSPTDDLRKLFQKGAHYLDWGISTVWIIDPEQRKAYLMTGDAATPKELSADGALSAVGTQGTVELPLSELFAEVDKMLAQ